jgi:hypothetical protein
VVSDGEFELVLADSYGRLEGGSQLAFTDQTIDVRATTLLDDGSRREVCASIDRADGPPLGRRLAETGQLVKARLADGEYLLFRGLPAYRVAQTAVSAEELATRAVVSALE